MAGQAAAVITEDDNNPDTNIGRAVAEERVVLPSAETDADAAGEEFVPQFEDEGGTEGRLTQEEVSERPLLEQQVYSKEQVAAMSPEQRREAWRGLPVHLRRENRHLERARKKDRVAQHRNNETELKDQVAFLSQEITRLKGGFQGYQSEQARGQLQGKITELDREIAVQKTHEAEARRLLASALREQDEEKMNAALDARDEAVVNRVRLEGQRNAYDQALKAAPTEQDTPQRAQPQQQQRQAAPRRDDAPVLNVVGQSYKQEFFEDNPWFDLAGLSQGRADTDTKIAAVIDNEVAADGFDPNTPEYWEELRERLEEKLPGRFAAAQPRPGRQQQQQQQQPRQAAPIRQAQRPPLRRGPPVGGGGDVAPQRQQKGVKITADRRSAMELAGVIDRDGTVLNKSKFQNLLRQYDNYDRANPEVRQ